MRLEKIRMIAAKMLNTGKSRILFDPENIDKIKECMTKEDIRASIKDGLIKKKRVNAHSRGRARTLFRKRGKGRKRGPGKRSGTINARTNRKQKWIKDVRAQRKKIHELKEKKVKARVPYSKVYRMIKGGYFKGKKYLEGYVMEAAK